MADGTQSAFAFPLARAGSRLRPGEIIVDLFAGGGGASTGLAQAIGQEPHVSINHNPIALAMHAANHPHTRHMAEDVFHTHPRRATQGRAVGWMHASPDCTHFSQAKGGQPRNGAIRSLSWVVLWWAGTVRPRIISLENVRQILQWGPLVAKRCKHTGRVLKLDGTVAAPGERVPIAQQHLVPDPAHKGRTWRRFVGLLRGMGYAVEWRELRACDYGAGTSRTRLFMIARCDGESICWPAPSHGTPGRPPLVRAADCIDWTIPGRSIFDRPRPLADATLRRIARGVHRYVLNAAQPFIVEHANASNSGIFSTQAPLGTQCAAVKGGHFAAVAPVLVQAGHGEGTAAAPRRSYGANSIRGPVGTTTASGGHAIASAHIVKWRGDSDGHPVDAPLPTITSGAGAARPAGCAHAMAVSSAVLEQLSPDHEAGALRVAAFLINYYGNGQALDLRESVDTITTRDRLALVTVTVQGTPYVIVDIRLRMLTPRELFTAQGFPPDYVIDRTADGRRLTISQQVALVGNSVSPQPMRALADANLPPAIAQQVAA